MEMRSEPISAGYVVGAVDLTVTNDGLQAWRLPPGQLRLFPPDDGLPGRAAGGSGVRLRLRTNTPCLELRVAPGAEDRRFDLTGDDDEFLAEAVLPAGGDRVVFTGLPTDYGELSLWLPMAQPTIMRELAVAAGARLDAAPSRRTRWVHYGSSISQCNGAAGPARTWPAIVSRTLGLDLTSLGFSGQCHLDPLVALTIARLPMDLLTLKLGINVHGAASLSPRSWRPAVIGFIRIIRERQPDVPIGVISCVCCPAREKQANAVGFSLEMMRHELEDAVHRLREAGDDRLRYFHGHAILGPGDTDWLLPDGLHPSAEGYANMGPRAADHVLRPLCHEFGLRCR